MFESRIPIFIVVFFFFFFFAMSESPTSPAPPGGDQNRGPTVEIVTWVFTSVALITVFLRLLTRLRITRNPGWDDFWIGLAMVAIDVTTSADQALILHHSDSQPHLLNSRCCRYQRRKWKT